MMSHALHGMETKQRASAPRTEISIVSTTPRLHRPSMHSSAPGKRSK